MEDWTVEEVWEVLCADCGDLWLWFWNVDNSERMKEVFTKVWNVVMEKCGDLCQRHSDRDSDRGIPNYLIKLLQKNFIITSKHILLGIKNYLKDKCVSKRGIYSTHHFI